VTEQIISQKTPVFQQAQLFNVHSRIASIKSPSFCTTTCSADLTILTDLLPQSGDCSCHINKRKLAAPPLWLQAHTDLRANDFAHSPDLWYEPRFANFTFAWSWRLCGINPTV